MNPADFPLWLYLLLTGLVFWRGGGVTRIFLVAMTYPLMSVYAFAWQFKVLLLVLALYHTAFAFVELLGNRQETS